MKGLNSDKNAAFSVHQPQSGELDRRPVSSEFHDSSDLIYSDCECYWKVKSDAETSYPYEVIFLTLNMPYYDTN